VENFPLFHNGELFHKKSAKKAPKNPVNPAFLWKKLWELWKTQHKPKLWKTPEPPSYITFFPKTGL
jgi:hypothetical protein